MDIQVQALVHRVTEKAELSASPARSTATMAASEMASSLVIRNSLHALSATEILSARLHNQITAAIGDLQRILITLELTQSGTDHDQKSGDHGSGLLDQARDAVDIAEELLLKASQRLKSHRGHLAKIRRLGQFMLLGIRVVTAKKIALHFISRVQELSTQLSQMQDLPPQDLHILDENASSSNVHQRKLCWNGKVESEIAGRNDEVHELLAQLTSEDGDRRSLGLRIVSVVGEEAIGKTALVRSVYNKPEIDKWFQCRVWVHVPEGDSLKGLLVKILMQTPLQELKDLEHMERENLEEILHKSLMELRYLIVFDNLHEAKVMDEIMILLADSRNGSRVIVTARDTKIASLLDPWASPLELKKLGEEQSKCLFGKCGSVNKDPGLKARILGKCNGSPLSILLLRGLAMASDDSSLVLVDQWANNPALNDIVSLSYRKLPPLLKTCLLYLSLFPKDSEISTRRLFRLWLAEGLVPVLEFSDMKCFKELVGRNLVHVVRRRKLSGRPKSCRLPSFLHDFLCKMATRLGLLQIHSDTKGIYHCEESKVVNGCLWIVKYQDNNYHQESQQRIGTEDHQQGNIQVQNLRSYVSFKMQKQGTRSREVEELLRPLISKGECGLLRVLDLEGVYKPLLPDRLGNVLLNLRYLGLRRTVLDSIPESVGNMSRLETLDLKHTNIRNLPSSIWKVKSLQHLYMNDVCCDKSTNRHTLLAEYLSNIQTLWGLYIGAAKSSMLDVLGKLSKLKKLGLTCSSPVVKKATECILKLPELQSLKLRSGDFFGQPSDLNLSDMTRLDSLSELYLLGGLPEASVGLLPRKLKILTLSMSGLGADPMRVLGKLESLEILNLFAGSYTPRTLKCGAESFPMLRVLKLWMLGGLEAAIVDETALCRLVELEIKNCGLTRINSLSHIRSLKQISLIKVKEELATRIKDQVPHEVHIKEKQLVTSSSSVQATRVQ